MIPIAILIPTLDEIGGAERQVLHLAKELARRNWKVTLISLSGNGATVIDELTQANVEYRSLAMRKAWIDPRGWLAYLTWARHQRPAVIHAHLPHATWFARCVRLLSPVPAVLDTIHTSRPVNRQKRMLFRTTSWLSNHTTCVSKAVAQSALNTGILKHGASSIVYNGVTLTNFTAVPKNAAEFHWIAIGRLAPVKDYPTLLHAFAALPGNAHPVPFLTIVGTGPEERSLRHLATNLGIEPRVHFAGFHPDVQPLLAQADAFVLTSLWEGLPVSILEAQAAGLPVVATNGEGTSEAMVSGDGPAPGVTGLLAPVGNRAKLAEAMAKIMAKSPTERSEISLNARRFIEQNFALPVIVDQWEELYRQLLERQPNPSRHG